MIQPVKCRNTVETAIENIGNYIAGHLQVGDVLPSERELAEQLCISRNITREALQHFRTLGIIESKPKIGATVARLSPGNVYEGFFPFLSASEHNFEDLAHLHLMLELGCAERAILNATPEKTEELYALSEKIQSLSGELNCAKSRDELFKTDMQFHSRLMELSGNTLLESLTPLVVEFFGRQYIRALASRCGDRLAGYDEHFKMVEALKEKDLDALSALIRSHIGTYIEAYKA